MSEATVDAAHTAGSEAELLEREIRDLAARMGIDLIGFTDAERLEKAPPSGQLRRVLPNAESAIGFAVALDEDAVYKFMRKEDYWALNRDHQEGYHKLTAVGRALKKLLEERGHDVYLPLVNYAYEEGQPDPHNRMTPDISLKYVCEAAGIGWQGWSGNLLTREYGANVSIGCVVTSARLEPSPIVVEDWCSECRICTAVCPTHYMPKQEADEVEIAGHTTRYSHRRSAMVCALSCSGRQCKRNKNSRWSIWGSDFIEDMPDGKRSDEEFVERTEAEYAKNPDDPRLHAITQQTGYNYITEENVDDANDNVLLYCSLCQLVCVPGKKKRQEAYRLICNSGHVIENDPRMTPPEDMPSVLGFYDDIVPNEGDPAK